MTINGLHNEAFTHYNVEEAKIIQAASRCVTPTTTKMPDWAAQIDPLLRKSLET